jgi:hypothetical protein
VSTIVGVMDRAGFDANTDNLVLVEPARERLLWVPRDLWCPALGDRVNAAFRSGGHPALVAALREHGLLATHSLVLSRTATEAALAPVAVLVPVPARMTFAYPLSPTDRIEDGSKPVTFEPPAEVLRGERLHQWIGARGGSDLHRIERQKVLVRRLLETRFRFDAVLADPEAVRCSGPGALDDLGRVRPTWRLETLDGLAPAVIGRRQVLVRGPGAPGRP